MSLGDRPFLVLVVVGGGGGEVDVVVAAVSIKHNTPSVRPEKAKTNHMTFCLLSP